MTTKLKYWRKDVRWLSGSAAETEIERQLADLQELSDVRSRWKSARALSHAAASLAFNDDGLTLDGVERSLQALSTAHRNGGKTEFSGRAMSFLARERLSILGLEDPKIILEKRKRVHVETACIAFCSSPGYANAWLALGGKSAVEALNSGKLYLLSLGGDGAITVRLRLIEGSSPIMMAKEYAAVLDVAQPGYLEAGTHWLGEAADLKKGVKVTFETPVIVQAYLLNRSGHSSLTFVACSTDERPNALTAVPELHP